MGLPVELQDKADYRVERVQSGRSPNPQADLQS
jgi:hypothetical protein